MPPGDIAGMNDILQAKPYCNGNPLGARINRVFLVNDEMLKGKQAANPDLWRRLGQMEQVELPTEDAVTESVTDDILLEKATADRALDSKDTTTVDFALTDDWYQCLFGNITVNEKGDLTFSKGILSRIPANSHLILKNAPWENSGFKRELAAALRLGGFEANKDWIKLPENLSLSRIDLSIEALQSAKSQWVNNADEFNAEEPVVCINSETIENLKSPMRVEGCKVVKTDKFAALLSDCRQMVVTNTLSKEEWTWLVSQLSQLPEENKPSVFTDLPAGLLLPEDGQVTVCNQSKVSTKAPDALHYNLSANDSLDSFQRVKLDSKNNFAFSLQNSPLMDNLINGIPVVLSGLEKNPKLAASLETLLLPEPYLLLNGHKVKLPKANITLVKPGQYQPARGSRLISQSFSAVTSEEQSTTNPIYSLLQKLRPSDHKRYPNTPPWRAETFDEQLKRQIEVEREIDGASQIKPYHERRALHALLAKAYRGDPDVYGFIKAKIAQYYPDPAKTKKADKAVLTEWLQQHPEPDADHLKSSFWQLVRHCPAEVHSSINDFGRIDERSLKKLATYLVGVAPKGVGQELAKKFGVALSQAHSKKYFNGTLRSTLRDALLDSKPSLKEGVAISESVDSLEQSLNSILAESNTEEEKTQAILETVKSYFKNDQLPAHYDDLPQALLNCQRHTTAQQRRRLKKLARRVEEHPIVFLQGEAGAGKTFMAQAIARINHYHDCQVIQLSPNKMAQELFGGEKLINTKAGESTDASTEFKEGPLLAWAMSDNPPLLVLDEANLAPEGLLAPLAGLTEKPPFINYQGRAYPLTDKHRIILTGNPDHYEGRHLDETLRPDIPTFFYQPLPDKVLAESIIRPGLPKSWNDGQRQQASDRILTLFNLFRDVVPGDLMTPRDTKDVLATIRQILPPEAGSLSSEQINALVRRAFMDSLAGAVPPEQQRPLTSINIWYEAQFEEDNTVSQGVDKAFSAFISRLQENNPDADFTPAPFRKLVYRYWQSLEKDDQGRTATLVEGPAGWGKDFILDKTIELWQSQQPKKRPCVHINANPSQWSALVKSVKNAMENGELIAISELNLIPSSYLEGLFNDVLTGDAAPGFRLFATVNPGSFDGRESLSPALKSRCTQIKLDALSKAELEGLIKRMPHVPDGLPKWLAGHFHQLSTALGAQHSPVQLALDDLFNTAKHLAGQPEERWQEALHQHLSLPFRSLTTPLPPVENDEKQQKIREAEELQRLELERQANALPGLASPITIKSGSNPEAVREQTKKLMSQAAVKAAFSASNRTERTEGTPVFSHSSASRLQGPSRYEFGDIIGHKHYDVTRYFPKSPYDARQYRLELSEVKLKNDGLCEYPVNWTNDELTPVEGWPDSFPWRTRLEHDELPGQIELSLSNEWQALPALSAADQLKALKTDPEIVIELAQCKKTGQILIRSMEEQPEFSIVDFIITPSNDYFSQLQSSQLVRVENDLCSPYLKELLDNRIFTGFSDPDWEILEQQFNTTNSYFSSEVSAEQAMAELRGINDIEEISERLLVLMDWLDTFSDDENVGGQDEDLLINMLTKKQGVCRHKAMLFQMLCHYWGVPARLVSNASHYFVEVSADHGTTWHQYQLGGGGDCSSDTSEPDWDEYERSESTSFTPPAERQPRSSGRSREKKQYQERNFQKGFGKLARDLIGKKEITKSELENLKDLMKGEIVSCDKGANPDKRFPGVWNVLLTSDFYPYIQEDNEWCEIIKKAVHYCPMRKNVNSFYISNICNDIKMKIGVPSYYKDYMEWIIDIFKSNDVTCQFFIGELQESIYRDQNHPLHSHLKERLTELIGKQSLAGMKLIYQVDERVNLEKKHIELAEKIKPSNYLSSKTSQQNISKSYYSIPKDNSQLIPDRLASGAPAFLTQTTKKSGKPVVFDLNKIGVLFQKKIEKFYEKNEAKQSAFYKNAEIFARNKAAENNIEEKYYEEYVNHNMMSFLFDITEEIFLLWLSQQKKTGSNWYWLLCEQNRCFVQSKDKQIPVASFYNKVLVRRMAVFEFSSEKIKEYLNEPSAVVIKEKGLMVMLDEFLDAIK